MRGIASGTTPAGPERVDKTQLLARVEDLPRLLIHGTEDLGSLVNGNEVILTPGLMPRARLKSPEVILHGHGESTEPGAVSFAQGNIDEYVHRSVN